MNYCRIGSTARNHLGTNVVFVINDITENITSEIRLFPDDCILYRTISSPTNADLLQKDLGMLTEWKIRWQMSFNHKKFHIMHISNLRSREVLYDYTMRGAN